MIPLAAALGHQLALPSGRGGRLVGGLMRLANRRPTRLAIAALDVRHGDTVLDLGCGSGDALPSLLRRAQNGLVLGVDHSPDAVAAARQRCPRARVEIGTFMALPFATASIDRVLASNVAYFWHDDVTVLHEIRRVLRPDGRATLYVTDATALRRIGLDKTGTHRVFDAAALARMAGPQATVCKVNAGLGISGWLVTIPR